jgi:hypothetical protein
VWLRSIGSPHSCQIDPSSCTILGLVLYECLNDMYISLVTEGMLLRKHSADRLAEIAASRVAGYTAQSVSIVA